MSREALTGAEQFKLLLRLLPLMSHELFLTPSVAPQGRQLRLTVPHLPWTLARIVL